MSGYILHRRYPKLTSFPQLQSEGANYHLLGTIIAPLEEALDAVK
jgi:hypothetical protein